MDWTTRSNTLIACRAVLWSIAALVVASHCGSRTGAGLDTTTPASEDRTAGDAWPQSHALRPNDPDYPPGHVGAGSAYVGAWIYRDKAFYRNDGCTYPQTPNKHLLVPPFWLDRFPVTTSEYHRCVLAGPCTAPRHDITDPDTRAWDDPGRSDEPIALMLSQAETFCTWREGRLPSWAELVRAMQGDSEALGHPILTQRAIQCFDGAPSFDWSEDCRALRAMNYPKQGTPPALPNPLYPVGSISEDMGPFGHHDLFGSSYEWTATRVSFQGPAFCGLVDGSTDFGDCLPGDCGSGRVTVQFATSIIRAVLNGIGLEVAPVSAGTDSTIAYDFGVRCAYDHKL